MKLKTLNALGDYIMTVNKSIRDVATFGHGADLTNLTQKTVELYDALEVENVTEAES